MPQTAMGPIVGDVCRDSLDVIVHEQFVDADIALERRRPDAAMGEVA